MDITGSWITPLPLTKETHPRIVRWIYELRRSSGHEPLYEGFERLRPLISSPSEGANAQLFARDVFAALPYEVYFVLRSFERQGGRDVFSLETPGDRFGTYELESTRHFIGECGGPHEERTLVVASTWRQYVQRCLDLLWLLVDDRLVSSLWPDKGLSQEESEWLCEPLKQRIVEGHRGCWQAHFVNPLDEKRVFRLLRELRFVLPASEERYLSCDCYPPDKSIFSNPDDDIFRDILEGLAKSRSAFAKSVLSRFQMDDEDWVRQLATQRLQEFGWFGAG